MRMSATSLVRSPAETEMLATLPNEVIVKILSYLDSHSLISLRASCRHLRQITSDPICWQPSLSWKGKNRFKDVDVLKLVLKLSENVLKQFSLSCIGYGYPLSQYIGCIEACHSLESLSLSKVECTKAQVERLLCLPSLTYLHVDLNELDMVEIFEAMARNGCKLRTLSFKEVHNSFRILPCIEAWTRLKCNPPDLRIVTINGGDIYSKMTNILGLRPSISHDAYLTLYDEYCTEGITPIYPCLQYHFKPIPSLSMTSPCNLPLVLTADKPGSGKLSYAIKTELCQPEWMAGKLEFSDVCHGLTVMDLGIYIPPSFLETVA